MFQFGAAIKAPSPVEEISEEGLLNPEANSNDNLLKLLCENTPKLVI
jgi:hypothetical protein